MSELVSGRAFGDAVVSVVLEGTTEARLDQLLGVDPAEARAAVPEADATSAVLLGFTVCHVRLGAASVLIDTGVGSRRGPGERYTAGVEAGLAEIRVSPADVTHVVITHAHWDHHYGALDDGRPRYPNARYLIGRGDWDAARSGTYVHDLGLAILEALDAAGVLELVDGDCVVAPGITMLDAPGESPGHHVVLAEAGGEAFMHLADLYHHPVELARGWVQTGTDPALVQRSRERILGEALRRNAIVTAAHDLPPCWRRVVRTETGYGVTS